MNDMPISMKNNVNILLIEDDDGDAKAVLRAFHNVKIANKIFRATDGIQALDMLKGQNGQTQIPLPFVILVDLNMPRMNGIQFIQALREDEDLRQSIVFMLTTSKREEDKAAAYELNVAGYIIKETAGADFIRLVNLVDCFWRIVEMP